MVRMKRRSGVWHHQVPDFKLVYCGPKKRTNRETTKHTREKRFVKVSITSDGDSVIGREVEATEKT